MNRKGVFGIVRNRALRVPRCAALLRISVTTPTVALSRHTQMGLLFTARRGEERQTRHNDMESVGGGESSGSCRPCLV